VSFPCRFLEKASHSVGTLPLLVNNERPRIDFVLFLIDTTNKFSLEMFRKSLLLVDFDYYFGKCSVLVVNRVS